MNIWLYILAMAAVTYLIRWLPFVLVKKEIRSPFVKSFLYYVPYVCLAAMTFPAILSAPEKGFIPGAAAFLVAFLISWKRKSLIIVALAACLSVLAVEAVMRLFS